MLRELQIPNDLKSQYLTGGEDGAEDPYQRLVGLSKLNVFIGPNNSGKSRLLRALFAAQPLVGSSEKVHGDSTDAIRARVRVLRAAILDLSLEQDYESVRNELLAKLRRCTPRLQYVGRGSGSTLPQEIETGNDLGALISRLPSAERSILESRILEHGEQLGSLLDALRRDLRSDRQLENHGIEQGINRFYIPTLRGLRPIAGEDVFSTATTRDFFGNNHSLATIDGKGGLLEARGVITGQSLCQDLRRYLLGSPTQRRLVAQFERFLSETFYRGVPLTLMPRDGSDVLHINFGSDDQPVHLLGDGVSQSIILLLPLFLYKEQNALIFIEEPELFLHAGFQRVFIETAISVGPSVQVFVTTHSQQFLDVTMDRSVCSIYRCETGTFVTSSNENVPFRVSLSNNDHFSILRELGVRNSSVLLSNCTIWVEGITDRLYISHFLKLFQRRDGHDSTKVFLEDLHFSFVEYGGGNITHWSFLDEKRGINVDRLCGRALLIADKDENKESRHERLNAALGDRFLLLPCREIENLLPEHLILEVVQEYEGPAAKLNSFERTETFLNSGLGAFIQDHVLPDGKSVRKSKSASPYAEPSGTIKNKPEFCLKAISHLHSFDELSDEAKQLTRAVHQFISDQNR